jgi:glycosyltransferase involved in cell wall biosynthesis
MLNDGIQVVDSPLWQIEGMVTAVSGEIPTVLRLQTAGTPPDRNADAHLLREMEHCFIQQAAHLVSHSYATVAAVQNLYASILLPHRLTIIPPGIVPVREEMARPFNRQDPPATLTVLCAGRLEKENGSRTLLAAIPYVAARLPHARFVIVDLNNSHQDDLLAEHSTVYATAFQHQHPQLAGRVHFTSEIREETWQQHIQNCALFVVPSLNEPAGLVYLEAMNYAKPVIGYQHEGTPEREGIPEVVEHGITGLLVEPKAAALAETMQTLLQSPDKLYEMGTAGRQRLLDHFTHVQMARQFATLYRSVLKTCLVPARQEL